MRVGVRVSSRLLELNLAKPNHVLAAGVGKTLPRDALRALLRYDFADAILSRGLLLQLTPRLAFGLFGGAPLASSADISKSFGTRFALENFHVVRFLRGPKGRTDLQGQKRTRTDFNGQGPTDKKSSRFFDGPCPLHVRCLSV